MSATTTADCSPKRDVVPNGPGSNTMNTPKCAVGSASTPMTADCSPKRDVDPNGPGNSSMNTPKGAVGSTSTPMTGRVKENVAGDAALRCSAMSASSLSAMSFELPPGLLSNNNNSSSSNNNKVSEVPDAMYASSGSSTCTRESDPGAFSDADSSGVLPSHRPRLDRGASDKLNAKVSLRQTSRQGRSTQRWVTEESSGATIRLVTGCVPILKGGKIMFVSSSRKPEWILPKGGWETDEAMEESAVRECFEEAGVLGVLGPTLKTIEYETRKAKKRRLEQEESQRANKEAKKDDKNRNTQAGLANDTLLASPGSNQSSKKVVSLSSEALASIQGQQPSQQHQDSGTTSNASEDGSSPSNYSKVRMTLFPLYVSQVLEKWPEDGRFRKAVDIDEALKLLDSRPEQKEALQDVKSRGLHLLSRPRESIPPFEN